MNFITRSLLAIAVAVVFSSAAHGQSCNQLQKYTVAALPSATSFPSCTVQVVDGTSAIDCTVGGGSTNVMCTAKSGVWAAINSGVACPTCMVDGGVTLSTIPLNTNVTTHTYGPSHISESGGVATVNEPVNISASGAATSSANAGSFAETFFSSGFNSGLVLNISNNGAGYSGSGSCAITGGTFTVQATCLAAISVTSGLNVSLNNPGVYTSVAGAVITISGFSFSTPWAGTLSLSAGAQQALWSISSNWSGGAISSANSLFQIIAPGRPPTTGFSKVAMENLPLPNIGNGWIWNLDNPNQTGTVFANDSMIALTASRNYSEPDASGVRMVIVAIVAATNCGSLSGSTGCYQVNDGTGLHYIPKW